MHFSVSAFGFQIKPSEGVMAFWKGSLHPLLREWFDSTFNKPPQI